MRLKAHQATLIKPVSWNSSISLLLLIVLVLSSFVGALTYANATAAPVYEAQTDTLQSTGQPALQPAVQAWMEQHPGEPVRVIAQARGEDVPLADHITALGGSVVHDLPMLNAVAAEIPASNIAALSASPDVRWISLDAQVISSGESTPDWGSWGNWGSWGPSIENNTYLDTTHARQVRDAGLDGKGIGVAVIDSGIAYDPDLYNVADRIKFNPNTNYPNDNYGHGTHVAGIIGGTGQDSFGRYQGVAPGVTLYGLKIADERGMAYESDTVAAMQWVLDNHVAHNIRVVNLSINSTAISSYSESPLNAAVEIMWFNGIVVVASAGNTKPGSSTNPVQAAPANDPFVITVGASFEEGTGDPKDDSLAPFSAYGKTIDGFAKPDIVAPGTDIISVLASTSPWRRAYPDRSSCGASTSG